MSEQERDYIFTFGQSPEIYGDRAGKRVTIRGTYESALAEMVRRYGRNWAFQYTAEQYFDFFDKHPHVPMEPELEE